MTKKRLIQLVVLAAVLILFIKYSDWFLGALSLAGSVIRPLITGCIIAYILNIPVSMIEKAPGFRSASSPLYRIRRPVSIIGSLVIISTIIALIILIVIPQLIQAVGVLTDEIPRAVSSLVVWISSSDRDWPRLQNLLESLNLNWAQLFQRAVSQLTSGLSNIFSSTVSLIGTVGSFIVTFVVALIFSFYLLAGKERLFAQVRSVAQTYLKEKYYRPVSLFLGTAHDTFTKFIVGQCTEAVILGVLCTLGMFLFRFPYAAMIGTLIGATALLPVVGAYLGAFIGAFMIFTVDPLRAVGFLVFIVILQQIEGNLIYPRVVGSSVGLPGIWVLCAVTIGGGFGGIVGMLFAVPVTATVYKLVQRDVRAKRHGVPQGNAPVPRREEAAPPLQEEPDAELPEKPDAELPEDP